MAKVSRKQGATEEPKEPEAPQFMDKDHNPISQNEAQDRFEEIIRRTPNKCHDKDSGEFCSEKAKSLPNDRIPEYKTGSDKPIAYHAIPKIKVVLAECGMLRDNELVRQKKAGIVKVFGHMMLEGIELEPNKAAEVPETNNVLKAIQDGWVIYVGR